MIERDTELKDQIVISVSKSLGIEPSKVVNSQRFVGRICFAQVSARQDLRTQDALCDVDLSSTPIVCLCHPDLDRGIRSRVTVSSPRDASGYLTAGKYLSLLIDGLTDGSLPALNLPLPRRSNWGVSIKGCWICTDPALAFYDDTIHLGRRNDGVGALLVTTARVLEIFGAFGGLSDFDRRRERFVIAALNLPVRYRQVVDEEGRLTVSTPRKNDYVRPVTYLDGPSPAGSLASLYEDEAPKRVAAETAFGQEDQLPGQTKREKQERWGKSVKTKGYTGSRNRHRDGNSKDHRNRSGGKIGGVQERKQQSGSWVNR